MAIRDAIQQSLTIIPADAHVGLITYGRYCIIPYERNVFVHEIGFLECPKCYSFKGSKEYSPA